MGLIGELATGGQQPGKSLSKFRALYIMVHNYSDHPYAHGEPCLQGVMRTFTEDFIVDENLGFEPEGDGEHIYLHLRKRHVNTDWLAQQIAKFAGVKRNDVGFCGLKDRHAETSQWMSVYLPRGPEPDWEELLAQLTGDIKLIRVTRGRRKLRRGGHHSNAFQLIVRCQTPVNEVALQERLKRIAQLGVPNYFGEQRFGRQGQNLVAADAWLVGGRKIRDRSQKSMIMSAARSHLFNLVLAQRIRDGSWCSVLDGDVSYDGFPTGPLWGRGRSAADLGPAQTERLALEPVQAWLSGLEHCGLDQERRSMVLMPDNFQWQLTADALRLTFNLLPGQYATALLREIGTISNHAEIFSQET